MIANAENVADGVGITSRIAKRLLAAGVDVITLGNHAYRQREVYPYLDQEERILRPVNYPETAPGHGTCVVESARRDPRRGHQPHRESLPRRRRSARSRSPSGSWTTPARRRRWSSSTSTPRRRARRSPWGGCSPAGRPPSWARTRTSRRTTPTSCRAARPTSPTPGMTGPHDSVIGVRTDLVLRRFTTQLPIRFEPAEGDVRIEGVIFECDGGRPGDLDRGVPAPRRPLDGRLESGRRSPARVAAGAVAARTSGSHQHTYG